MANLLERYGLKEYTRPYSISFIDGFLDCSYKIFMTHFLKIRIDKTDFPRTFGSGLHRAFNKVNELIMNHTECCRNCDKDCKLYSPDRVKALLVPEKECRIKQLMMEQFLQEFNEDFEEKALSTMKNKTLDEIKEEIVKHKQYAYDGMCETIFKKQPRGEVLLTEKTFSCRLGEHDVLGIVDLGMEINKKGERKKVILDYKTAGMDPGNKLPIRQLSMYVHLMENAGIPANVVGAIYVLKKSAPKIVRKGSKPFEQVKILSADVDDANNRAIIEHNLDDLETDISQIKDCISHGIFTKNRKSMFCSTCELRAFCEDHHKLDKLVENGMNLKSTSEDKNETPGEEDDG